MRAGQLARQSRVSTRTLRHYERLGLLPLPDRTTIAVGRLADDRATNPIKGKWGRRCIVRRA